VLIQVKAGRITTVKGDPDSPVNYGVLCPKGQAAVELLYHPERLSHPLKQIGEKGRGQWTRISWDEALDTIADKLAGIRDAYGPEQVAFIQGSAKGLIDNYNERLANAFGTPDFDNQKIRILSAFLRQADQVITAGASGAGGLHTSGYGCG
jgi:anaerobic selenocysteine-containing dehydrogenase